jgi:pyridoxamine 5'-phosphate oxidase-like protein
LVRAAHAFLDAHVHKTIATLRKDGSPRISGIEAFFAQDDLWFGSMWQSVKAKDLLRDRRFALHSASKDPPGWKGDAKLAGAAEEVTDPTTVENVFRTIGSEPPSGESHLFRADVGELVVTRLGEPADHLVIESWREGRGHRRIERR